MSTKRAVILGVSIAAGLAVVDARRGDMTIQAIVTEGQEAAVVIENPGATVTCAIVQDAGDANLEVLRADEEIATAGSVACRAVLD